MTEDSHASDAKREAAGTEAPLHLVNCWACDTRVQIPLQSGRPVLTFKCGFCGALTIPQTTGRVPHKRSARQCPSARERACVAAVGVLITTFLAPGAAFVLPHWSATWWLHVPLTSSLLFAVVFFYHAAVTSDPGVIGCQLSDHRPVQQGSMEGYTYCPACESAKPADAHHCSTCGACIEGMDHHCLFIGNCVGAGNRRWFMVFLYWTLMACSYVAIISAATLCRRKDVVVPCWAAFQREFMWSRAYFLVWWILKVSPIWLSATLYLLSASLGVLVAAGMLMQQQLIWVLTGISYVDALKMARAPAGSVRPIFARRSLGERLQDVFGDEPAWRWLLPRMSEPQHSRRCKKGC